MEKGNLRALAPIGVFLVLYLGLGILFETELVVRSSRFIMYNKYLT